MGGYKILAFFGRHFLCETDNTRPAANLTTDNTFTATIGRKADTAATGAVGTTKSIAAYLKQIVTLLLGTAIGAPLHTAVAGVRVLMAGATIVTATGSVFIKAVHLKKLTTSESSGVTSFRLRTDDTVSLSMLLYKADGSLVRGEDFSGGSSFVFDVGWILSTTKILKLLSGGSDGQAAGYQVIVEAYALTEGASLA